VIKTLWGFTKVRYRGLHKNLVRAYAVGSLKFWHHFSLNSVTLGEGD